MKKSFNSLALLALTGAAMMSSCSKDTDLYDQNATLKSYEKNWTDTFGEVAADQDWNLATRCTANVDLSGIKGASTIKVYSSMPGGSDVKLIANYPASTTSFSFDYIKGASDVYVVVEDAEGYQLLGGYYDIDNGAVAISNNVTKAGSLTRAGSCNVKLPSEKVVLTNKFNDYNNKNFTDLWQNKYNADIYYTTLFDTYELVNASEMITTGQDVKISDVAKIVGTGGVFKEQGMDSDGKCNLIHWQTELSPENGVTYTVKETGEVVLNYFYYGTDYNVPFGYFYYKDGETAAQIARRPHYVITTDAAGKNYIAFDGSKGVDFANMETKGVLNYESTGNDHTLTSVNIKLAYFGENGTDAQGTYEFPQGTKIGFFIGINHADDYRQDVITHSLPEINKGLGCLWRDNHGEVDNSRGLPTFITYKFGGKVIMGLEDTDDHDMNDMLFYVENVDSTPIPEIGDEPEGQSWLIACEDLGSDHDYDFNDVVVKVSHVAGDTKLTLTPMAAGGTLPSVIYFNNTEIGEIHQLFSATANDAGLYSPINVNSSSTVSPSSVSAGNPKEITVGVPEDFTLTNSNGAVGMGNFTIVVNGNNENSAKTTIGPSKTGEVPQMFMVPATWAWPGEGVQIEKVYPNFSQWSSTNNGASWDWYNNTGE